MTARAARDHCWEQYRLLMVVYCAITARCARAAGLVEYVVTVRTLLRVRRLGGLLVLFARDNRNNRLLLITSLRHANIKKNFLLRV